MLEFIKRPPVAFVLGVLVGAVGLAALLAGSGVTL